MNLHVRQTGQGPQFLWWAMACLMLAPGCVSFPPSRSYENNLINYEAASGFAANGLMKHTLSVQANQRWQQSGVHVASGSTIKILAMGKWSQAPAINVWSGPEGLDSGPGKEVPWINSNALMARLG